ncbi:hypothetical protein LTR56_010229 [Elasticomyces elasticus]|nr:hypothetical protein LTR22_017220 [Elasticomyces elasticus]KAK3643491.1 hypothetical protein LTR56_010229 [Elasticomyces elasticus]KAK4925300.1 hypothetical protein LTR49_007598 [Elasticomyces elasticus]KAK5761329.1 hypothetical protein LTS12_008605 [Elasticomyces elasticus]
MAVLKHLVVLMTMMLFFLNFVCAQTLQINLYNVLPSADAKVYFTGKDPVDGGIRMMGSDGVWIDPGITRQAGVSGVQTIPADAITHHLGPQNTWTNFQTGPINSARIYVASGQLEFGTVDGGGFQEPSALNTGLSCHNENWGFVEFAYSEGGSMNINPTAVDFMGVPFALQMQTTDGLLETKGWQPDVVANLCSGLAAKGAADGQPWEKACVYGTDGSLLRVLSPHYVPELGEYWTEYVSEVWSTYSSTCLSIGDSSCQVIDDVLVCDNGEDFTRPTSLDVWGCSSGPFNNYGSERRKSMTSVLCAAFHRGTLLGPGGDVQPSGDVGTLYTTDPSNAYSRIVHELAIDHIGYGFPYDDVKAEGQPDVSGFLSGNALCLSIGIGGPLPE